VPAAAATRTPSPAAAGATSSGPADPVLQQAFAAAALQPSDLPAGYATAGAADTSLDLPGETASYAATYANISALPNVGLIVDSLLGFKDVATAQTNFANIQQLLQQADSSLAIKLTPVTTTAKLGDQTAAFSVSLSTQGLDLSGYLVVWRLGRLGGEVAIAGTSTLAPASADAVIALAQKKAAALSAIRQ